MPLNFLLVILKKAYFEKHRRGIRPSLVEYTLTSTCRVNIYRHIHLHMGAVFAFLLERGVFFYFFILKDVHLEIVTNVYMFASLLRLKFYIEIKSRKDTVSRRERDLTNTGIK